MQCLKLFVFFLSLQHLLSPGKTNRGDRVLSFPFSLSFCRGDPLPAYFHLSCEEGVQPDCNTVPLESPEGLVWADSFSNCMTGKRGQFISET